MMRLALIVAMAPDGLIGREGALPWHLPRDLRRFRKLTLGKPILMGRRTFESIGRPLDGRLNIVLTRRDDAHFPEGVPVAHSLREALQIATCDLQASGQEEALVIGGAGVFREALPRTDRIYRTVVEGQFQGDTYFPREMMLPERWVMVEDEVHPPDARNPHPMRFQVLERDWGA